MSIQARKGPREKQRKGKGQGSQSVSIKPGSRKETCKFWKAGHCHRGKDCAFQHPEKTVSAKKEDKKKKKKKKDKKPRKRSSSRGSSGSDNSTGTESQRRKGGKSSSSNAPAAVCLLRAVVMAAVVSQGSSVLITRPPGSVAMPVLSASNTLCTDFDKTTQKTLTVLLDSKFVLMINQTFLVMLLSLLPTDDQSNPEVKGNGRPSHQIGRSTLKLFELPLKMLPLQHHTSRTLSGTSFRPCRQSVRTCATPTLVALSVLVRGHRPQCQLLRSLG